MQKLRISASALDRRLLDKARPPMRDGELIDDNAVKTMLTEKTLELVHPKNRRTMSDVICSCRKSIFEFWHRNIIDFENTQ